MPQLSTLKLVADIVVSRILQNAEQYPDVAAALEEAYPFGDDPRTRYCGMPSCPTAKPNSDPRSEAASKIKDGRNEQAVNEVGKLAEPNEACS
jgi:hypothetical protein